MLRIKYVFNHKYKCSFYILKVNICSYVFKRFYYLNVKINANLFIVTKTNS